MRKPTVVTTIENLGAEDERRRYYCESCRSLLADDRPCPNGCEHNYQPGKVTICRWFKPPHWLQGWWYCHKGRDVSWGLALGQPMVFYYHKRRTIWKRIDTKAETIWILKGHHQIGPNGPSGGLEERPDIPGDLVLAKLHSD